MFFSGYALRQNTIPVSVFAVGLYDIHFDGKIE